MTRRTTLALGLGGLLGASGLVCVGAASWLLAGPPAVSDVAVQCRADLPPLAPRRPLRVLVWNLQFGAGRAHHFFYEAGGEAVSVSAEEVEATLQGMAAVISAHDPDVVLLQEVDRGSRRTAYVDELARLNALLDYPCHASAAYHQLAYVPHPAHEHLGKVDMHLAVLSRYPIQRATRYQLPLLDEPVWRRVFNLHRALLELELPLKGGGTLRLFNTHLSAFSRGDGTLGKQVAMLSRHLSAAEQAGQPWLLAGDLNALPPGDSPSRLPPEVAEMYPESQTPIQPLFDQFETAVPPALYAEQPELWRTFLPYGEPRADRTLDYVFHGAEVDLLDYAVLSDANTLSDHLPLLFELQLSGSGVGGGP